MADLSKSISISLADNNLFSQFISDLTPGTTVKFTTEPIIDIIDTTIYKYFRILGKNILFINPKLPLEYRNILISLDVPVNNKYKIVAIEKSDEIRQKTYQTGEIVYEGIQENIEERLEEISQWKKEYNDEDIRQSIIDDLNEYYDNKKDSYNIFFESQSIMDMVQKYQAPDNGNLINDISRKGSDYKPQLKAVLEYNFQNVNVYPIVADKKKIYTEVQNLLNTETDETMEHDHTLYYLSFNEEMDVIRNLYKEFNNSTTKYKTNNKSLT